MHTANSSHMPTALDHHSTSDLIILANKLRLMKMRIFPSSKAFVSEKWHCSLCCVLCTRAGARRRSVCVPYVHDVGSILYTIGRCVLCCFFKPCVLYMVHPPYNWLYAQCGWPLLRQHTTKKGLCFAKNLSNTRSNWSWQFNSIYSSLLISQAQFF